MLFPFTKVIKPNFQKVYSMSILVYILDKTYFNGSLTVPLKQTGSTEQCRWEEREGSVSIDIRDKFLILLFTL